MNKKFYVRYKGTERYSMFGFIMFTEQIEHAKKYSLEEARKLKSEIDDIAKVHGTEEFAEIVETDSMVILRN